MHTQAHMCLLISLHFYCCHNFLQFSTISPLFIWFQLILFLLFFHLFHLLFWYSSFHRLSLNWQQLNMCECIKYFDVRLPCRTGFYFAFHKHFLNKFNNIEFLVCTRKVKVLNGASWNECAFSTMRSINWNAIVLDLCVCLG